MTLRVAAPELAELDAAAARLGMARSEVVRQAVRALLDEQNAQQQGGLKAS